MDLFPGFAALAAKLQEAATALSHDDIRTRISQALADCCEEEGEYTYPVDIFGDDKSGDVVYSTPDGLMRAKYKMGTSEGKPTCTVDAANAVPVVPKVSYEASRQDGGGSDGKESAGRSQSADDRLSELATVDLTGDVIPLREGAVGQDGTAHIKLITPGWGSCGYYPPDVLERDGPVIFKAGTKSFWNHQTESEERERPEGDLRDLASVLTEDARYEKDGPAGPGLYAKAKVFEQFRQPVDDLAKHIGMSIRACGIAKEGKAEGRTGPIIEKLTRGISVDYVTTPGAGGKILQLFEAARSQANYVATVTPPAESTTITTTGTGGSSTIAWFDASGNLITPTPIKEAATDMDAAEIKKLQEAQADLAAENRKLRERFALADAATEARKYFTTVTVAEAVQERVLGRVLAGSIPLTEAGDLDIAKLTERVAAETKDELAYINKLSGGRIVTDMGTGSAAPQLTEAQLAEAKKLNEAVAIRNADWLGATTEQGRKIFVEGPGAFNPNFNARTLREVQN